MLPTVLTGARVFTGAGDPLLNGGAVELRDGRITRVGPEAEIGREGNVIAFDGCSILPGVIDTHIHIFHEAQMMRLAEGAAALWGANYMQSALRAGVTTVRDLGAQTPAVHGLKAAIQAGYVVGPRILTCGTAICMTGGHGWANLSREADGPDAVRQLARQQIKTGADVIKVMASGGAGTPGELPTSPQLSVAEIRAAAEEAHAAGLPITAHALAREGILNAIEAGVDTIEHGVFLDDEGIELMLKHDVALCPTISVYPRIVERGPDGGEAPFVIEKSKPLRDVHLANFARAVAAGVRVVFGTDSATLYNPVGDFGDEIGLMAEAGMPAESILLAATARAAEACRIADRVGTLEPGKEADILIVEGDPMTNIADLTRTRCVFSRGRNVFDSRSEHQSHALVAPPVLQPR